MYSKKILRFSSFLGQSPNSYNEIARFLVLNSFRIDGALSIYIGELTESGAISPLGLFGWSPQELETFTEVPFNVRLPICDSIRENEIIVVTNGLAFYEQYPLMQGLKLSQPWITGVAIPVYPLGGLIVTFATTIQMTEPMKLFFTAIGSLLGLHASRLPGVMTTVGNEIEREINLSPMALTNRQSVIAELLEKGFSNAQIGVKLGYSESLIRQETVTVYRKRGVNGRKAMQVISALKLEEEARGKIS